MTVSVVGWLVVAAIAASAGAWGAWDYWRARPSRGFWVLLRVAHGLVIVQLAAVVAVYASGRRPDDDLYYLYCALPVLVSFLAEQLRVLAAQTVLDRRGLEDAQAVGRLPEDEQRSVALSIVQREVGVMAIAAPAIAGLAVRAAMTF